MIAGLEAAQKLEGMVVGGSMDVVLPILMGRIWEEIKKVMMASYGTSMARTTEALNLVL